MRAALYLRVSTDEQTLASQRRDLLDYAGRREFEVVETFEDHGYSGALRKRPALDDMMRRARRREFDVLLVWRFDRLSRSVAHLVGLMDEFRELGVEVVSYNDAIDTTTPMGKAMFAITAAFAELERDTARERIKAGLSAARAAGVRLGRPPNGAEVTPEALDAARALRESGASIRETARQLGVPKSTLARQLNAGSQCNE